MYNDPQKKSRTYSEYLMSVQFMSCYQMSFVFMTIVLNMLFQKEQLKQSEKQPFADVLQNRCSYKFCNVYRKTLVLESLYNKNAGLQAYEYGEILKNSYFYRTSLAAASSEPFFVVNSLTFNVYII